MILRVFIKDSASQLPQTEYNINNNVYTIWKDMERYEIQIKQYLNYFGLSII